jgi:hypothetical protein
MFGLATVGANGEHCCTLGGMGRGAWRGRVGGAGAIDTTGMTGRSGGGVEPICGAGAATVAVVACCVICCWATGGPGTWTVCACIVVMPSGENKIKTYDLLYQILMHAHFPEYHIGLKM